MFGSKHTPLAGDPKYNASANFSKERIPQLKKAIEVLEQYKETPVKEKKESKKLSNQLPLWNK